MKLVASAGRLPERRAGRGMVNRKLLWPPAARRPSTTHLIGYSTDFPEIRRP